MVYMNIDSFKLQLLISYTGTLFDFFLNLYNYAQSMHWRGEKIQVTRARVEVN